MKSPTTSDDKRRRAFAAAFAEAMEVRRATQIQIASELGGLQQSTVSAWKSAVAVPDVETVFRLERALNLPPGNLSRHLGFMPPESVGAMPGIRDVILSDPLLDELGQRVMIATYNELTRPMVKAGRRPAKASTAKKVAR